MTATADHVERKRRASNKDRLLSALLERGTLTNVEAEHIGGLRFGGRFHELRCAGWAIDTEYCGGGLVRYRLVRPVPAATIQQELFGG